MKFIYELSKAALLLNGWGALAQVNLDEPLSLGRSDVVFRSAVDPNAAYFFPLALERVSAVTTRYSPDWAFARFSVGLDESRYVELQKELFAKTDRAKDLRLFRLRSYGVMSGTDLEDHLDPLTFPLGTLQTMGESHEFQIRIKRLKNWWGRDKSPQVWKTLFGASGQDHVADVIYTVSAISEGKPVLVSTRVPIFAGQKGSWVASPIGVLNFGLNFGPKILSSAPTQAISYHPTIIRDQDAACWEEPPPGSLCLR